MPDEQNGIIISYNVRYQAIPEAGSAGPFFSELVMAPTRQVNLTSLTKDMYYNVSVLASTSKGDGNYSNPKTLKTNEDSKSVFFNHVTFESKLRKNRFLFVITWCDSINQIGCKRASDKVKLTTKT